MLKSVGFLMRRSAAGGEAGYRPELRISNPREQTDRAGVVHASRAVRALGAGRRCKTAGRSRDEDAREASAVEPRADDEPIRCARA